MLTKNRLGKTGIEVTELCFGALPYGPLQKNLSLEECTDITSAALEMGINFVDTAQAYKTYEPIRLAMKRTALRPVIATKSAAKSYEDMQIAVDEALKALDADYIDIFHLHAARADINVFDERSGAFNCLMDNKAMGKIKAVGISTHSAAVTSLAAGMEQIDVVFPIINIKGMGILHGTRDEMAAAISSCIANDKGVYLMKVLAGGSLVDDYHGALTYARSLKGYSSIAIGMVSRQELDFNMKYFSQACPDISAMPSITAFKKQFHVVESLCKSCGTCITICPNNAITDQAGKALIDKANCLQCGYCIGECKEFAIRLI